MADSATSIWDQPEPRGVSVVQGMLRVIVALQFWGAAAHRLQSRSLSDLGQYLFREFGAGSPDGAQFDHTLGLVLLFIGFVTLIRPVGLVLLIVSAGFCVHALEPFFMPAGTRDVFTPVEHLVRIASPLALALVDWWPPRLKAGLGRLLVALGLLRFGAAASIAAQGLRSLASLPDREQLLEVVRRGAVALEIPERTADQASLTLGFLGGIDVGMAILLVSTRSKFASVLVGMWSLFRISVWTLALGPEGYAETLVRAAQAGAPFVLAAFTFLAVREHPSEILPLLPVGKK